MSIPEHSHVRRKNGSMLLLAIIYTTVLSVMAGGILSRVMAERRISERSFVYASLLYTTEGYLEKAIWSINNEDWTGWQSFNNGADRYLPYTKVELGSSRSCFVHALVVDLDGTPTVYAESAIIAPDSFNPVNRRQLRLTFDQVSVPPGDVTRALPGGLIAQGKIEFSGKPDVDSYDSRIGHPDPFLNRGDQVTVATVSTSSDAMKLNGQVNIFGFAGTGRHGIEVNGPNNKVLGVDSEPGINIDWGRVYSDFVFHFPEIEEPDWSGAIQSIPEAKNKTVVLGSPVRLTKYDGKKIDISGNKNTKYLIVGPVQMRLSEGVAISGQASIEIANGGSLELYTDRDFNTTGQGLINKTSRPQNLKIFGTAKNTKGQGVNISGQALIEAIVYAPNAVVQITGQGDFAGSIVGYDIKYSGQGDFHYDVAIGGGADNPIDEDKDSTERISNWHDITPSSFSFDIESYVNKNGGSFHFPL